MKRISYIISAAFLAMLSLSSCSDFLEAENKSAGGDANDSETYFRTTEGLAAFRAYAFRSLTNVATALDINDDGTDLYMTSRSSANVFETYSLDAGESRVEDYYVACYELVNNANGLINYSGESNERYRMEGLFLRAYGYYLLTQHFGPVPYVDKYIQSSNRDYPRTDLETIYTNCENDLIEVINSGVLSDLTHDGSVNKRAAQALLAKIYLAHGWDCNTTLLDETKGTFTVNSKENFTKAAQMAEQAISGIFLTQSFEDKWLPSNEDTNPETFFAVQYDRASYPGTVSDGGHKLCEDYAHYYGSAKDGVKYTTSKKALNSRSLALWEKGDERWDATFMTTMYNYDTNIADWTKCGYMAYYNTSVDKGSLPIFMYFAPTYVTKDEFENYLTEHKSQFKKTATLNTNNKVQANLLHDGTVYVYKFNDDGSFIEPTAANGTLIEERLSDLNQPGVATVVGTQLSPCVKKWDDPDASMGGQTNSYRDIVLLHASEVYLTAAEAYYMADNESAAWTKINAVRGRAKAPSLSNSLDNYDVSVKFSTNFTLLNLILDERARECYAEQTRWMDLRRTKQLVRYNVAYNPFVSSVSDMQNLDGETKWYHPIPTAEFSNNTGMDSEKDQNPGY